MNPAEVHPGTAETLARVAHFRGLTDALPEAHELDPVIRFLIGRVGDPDEVLEQLHDELDQLWALSTDDWEPSMLDELTDDERTRYSFPTYDAEVLHRHGLTVARLVADIEGVIWRARIAAAIPAGRFMDMDKYDPGPEPISHREWRRPA